MPRLSKLFFPFIFVLYFVTRLPNLFSLPIFLDEALYLRMTNDLVSKGQIWVSFTDGKEPLYFWFNSFWVSLPADRLLASRFFSTLSGFGILVFATLLTKQVISKKAAFITGFLIIFSPFLFFYNRLAILDSFLTMILTAFVYFLVRSIDSKELKFKAIAGILLGLALLTKTISQIYFFALPLAFFLKPTKKNIKTLIQILAISLLIYLPLTKTPGFETIQIKNVVFKHSFSYSLINFNTVLIPNLKTLLRHWLPLYVGMIPLAVLILSAFLGVIRKNKYIVFLIILGVVPIIVQSFVAKIFFPRYFLFISVPFIVIISWGICELLKKIQKGKIQLVVLLLIVTQPIYATFNLLFLNNPSMLPEIEKWQYYYGWPSGGCMELPFKKIGRETTLLPKNGVAEVAKFHYYDQNINANKVKYSLANYYDKDLNLKQIPLKSSICQQPPKLYLIND